MTMERYECQDVQAVLSGLLDGELDAAASHLAEAHLAQCAPCRTLLQQAEETDDLLRATMARHEAWPAALERRIRAEIFGVVDGAEVSHRRRRLLFAAWSGWSIAAIVMLGFGVSLSTGRLGPRPAAPADSAPLAGGVSDAAPVEPPVWAPPVGSEELARGLFDDASALFASAPVENPADSAAPVEPEAPAVNATEMLASAERTPSLPAGLSERVLAGVESEMALAESLGDLALASAATPDAPAVAVEPAPPAFEAPAETLAMSEPAPADSPTTDPATAEVLHQASVLLTFLEQAGDSSFGDVRKVQQALTSDDVLERLALARHDLDSPDSVDLVNRAWTVLEWTTGSVDQEELERVRESIAMQDLPGRLERLSDRHWN